MLYPYKCNHQVSGWLDNINDGACIPVSASSDLAVNRGHRTLERRRTPCRRMNNALAWSVPLGGSNKCNKTDFAAIPSALPCSNMVSSSGSAPVKHSECCVMLLALHSVAKPFFPGTLQNFCLLPSLSISATRAFLCSGSATETRQSNSAQHATGRWELADSLVVRRRTKIK